MKLLLLYINFLVCFSALLDEIRKEVVDQALLKLPKRERIDILKMFLAMSNAKEDYLMTDDEIAYFAYKWIGQNIEIDCLGNKFGNSTTLPTTTYKKGKGGEIGISELFNMICVFLNIETSNIFGVKKTFTRNFLILLIYLKLINIHISIDNKYYLLDVTSGIGICSGTNFYKRQKDDYFGIDPELSIRHLFPNDKEWQLLSKPITEDQFSSQAILDEGFFKYFNKITPDIETIKEQTKVTLTLKDPKIEKMYIRDCFEIRNDSVVLVSMGEEAKIINGTCEFTIRPFRSGYAYLEVSDDNNNYYKVLSYGVYLS